MRSCVYICVCVLYCCYLCFFVFFCLFKSVHIHSGKERTYYVYTDTAQECVEWMEAIRRNASTIHSSSSSSSGGSGASCERKDDGNGATSTTSTAAAASTAACSEVRRAAEDIIAEATKSHPFLESDAGAKALLHNWVEHAVPRQFTQEQQQQQQQQQNEQKEAQNGEKDEAKKEGEEEQKGDGDSDDGTASRKAVGLSFWVASTSPAEEKEEKDEEEEEEDVVELCVAGPRAALSRGVGELFWKEGVPGLDTDRLAHACDMLAPQALCVWARAGQRGRRECGWRLLGSSGEGDVSLLGAASCLADPSRTTTDRVLAWLEAHAATELVYAGRSTKDAPRSTELCVALPGTALQDRLTLAKDALVSLASASTSTSHNDTDSNVATAAAASETTPAVTKTVAALDKLQEACQQDAPLYLVVEFTCVNVVQITVAAPVEKEPKDDRKAYLAYRWTEGCHTPQKIMCETLELC